MPSINLDTVTQEKLQELAISNACILGAYTLDDVKGTLTKLRSQVVGWRFNWIRTHAVQNTGIIKAIPTNEETKTLVEKALATRLIRRRKLHPYYAVGVVRIGCSIQNCISEKVIDFCLDFLDKNKDVALGEDNDAFPALVRKLKIKTTLSRKSLLLARQMIPKVRSLLEQKIEVS